MTDFIKKHRNIWNDNPGILLQEYNYQKSLTNKLDNLCADDFHRQNLYEIILWKINRFPEINDSLIKEVSGLSKLTNNSHRKSEDILKKLLKCKGIALPMASSILRFINPHVFQIIDDRAYRVLLPGKEKYPSKPQKITEGYLNTSCKVYFEYLDEINLIVSDNLPFEHSDRILYQLDIKLGNKIGD